MRSVAGRLMLCCALALACSASDPVEPIRTLQREGRHAESIEPLRELLEASPDDPELNRLYGEALIATGRHALARWPLRRAMEDPSWRAAAGLPLASSLLALGNHEAAIEVLDGLLAADPENVDALLVRAHAKLVSRQDYDGALADVERVRELDPDTPRALAPRAAALLGLERLDEVAETLEELEHHYRRDELDPVQAAHYCLTRATFAMESDEIDLARERFEGCLAESPLNDAVIQAAVEFHERFGDDGRALEILREALERVPEATLYRTALAERLEQRGEVEEAERLVLEGLDQGGAPDFAKWTNVSAHYQRQGRSDEAIDAFAKAVESIRDPAPAMLFEYAELLVLGGRFDRASEVARAIGVPAMEELVLARIHFERGEYEEALERFDAGLTHWPDNAVARYLAARAAERLGDFERAIAEYRYAIRADPAGTDARLRLVRLRIAEGDLVSARVEAVQAAGRAPPDREAELAVLEAMAETTSLAQQSQLLSRLSDSPEVADRALVATARGVARREGPDAAARYVERARGVDLASPDFSGSLDALVGYLIESERGDEARTRVAEALAARPESAVLRAVEAHRLERNGAEAAAVRAAYERALALDGGEPRALAGLARLAAAAGEVTAAVDLYRRAAAADPDEPEHRARAASLLRRAGRGDEALRELEQLLETRPYDARVALQLGALLLERGGTPNLERALALGQRALRFRGGAEAEALVTAARRQLAAAS